MLTYKQAAKKINVSLSKLYLLMRAGEIRRLELGPQVKRIALSECEAYVKRLEDEQYSPRPGEAA